MMKSFCLVIFCSVALLQSAAADDKPASRGQKKPATKKKPDVKKEAPLPFKAMKENISYGIGLDFGQRIYRSLMRSVLSRNSVKLDRKKFASSLTLDKELIKNLRKRGLDIDDKRMAEGFQDALTGAKSKMTNAHLVQVFRSVNEQLIAASKKLAEKNKKLAEKNKKEGKAFLEANKKKKGVKTTKSGLQYLILKAGKGKSPKPADYVVTHYKGTLIDGSVFDSSVTRGIPFSFRVGGGVIPGWTEAVQLMKKGAKWKFFIPSELAYTDAGKGNIGPNAVLIFELELLDINPKPKFGPGKIPNKGTPNKKKPR